MFSASGFGTSSLGRYYSVVIHTPQLIMIQRKKADIPVYSFEKHSRLDKTTTIYSPHVLILEGIFALHDPRVLDLLDLRIFAEADGDLCLSRRREWPILCTGDRD